ncbi:hypothetical protein FDA94_11350 [Herbidospora galbida]|uniref:DUF4386 family protein n=1 Tax=Herbidospora galbida TaxID=2575442 RepID=A0A4U3MLX4_9ACTN|nr:hypothetical protein [Herbidospora galbida]TKK89097.1 hypothetical protein FDA94_11350 [Herbidospora galbida]
MTDNYRRVVAAGALVAWPVLLFAAFLTSPPGEEHDPAVFASMPGQVQVSGLLFLYATLAMIPAYFGLAALLYPKARGLANTGLTLGLFGAAAACTLFTTDFYDLALAQTVPAETAKQVTAAANELPGFLFGMLFPGFLTHVGTLVLLIGLAVKKAAPWWVPVAVVAGIAVPFAVAGSSPAVQSIGSLLELAALGWVARDLLRTPTRALA